MSMFWIADPQGRVLGPVPLNVLQDLATAGKLAEVAKVSRDGQHWQPASADPELRQALASSADGLNPLDPQRAARLREQLGQMRKRPAHEVFQVRADATLDEHRTAFFALVKRFHPARLPPGTHEELKAACREAFEFLGTLMQQVERRLQPSAAASAVAAARPYRLQDFVGFTQGEDVTEATVRVDARNAGIFTDHMIANLSAGGVFLPSERPFPLGTFLELRFVFDPPMRQVSARGKVIWENAGALKKVISGVGVRFLRLEQEDKSFIQQFLSGIPPKERQVLRF